MTSPVEKSRRLLLENLTPEQRDEFERDEKFTVRVNGEQYEIRPDIVECLGDRTRYCAAIPGLPVYDQMLARKLHLERDAESFFRAANVFVPGRSGRMVYPPQRLAGDELTYYFRVCCMHECQRHGMDGRLIEVQINEEPTWLSRRLRVVYARRWDYWYLLDELHFRHENWDEVLRFMAEQLMEKIWQRSNKDLRGA